MAAFGSQDKGEHAKACVFCAIANGKIKSKKVYEDGDCIAFLDINPRSRGMSIVVPKTHYADIDEQPELSVRVFEAAERVTRMVKAALRPRFVEMGVIPSDEVPHFHIRLYPVYADEKPIFESAPLQMNEPELDELAEKISDAGKSVLAPKKGEEKQAAEEREWSKEDADYIRKQSDRA